MPQPEKTRPTGGAAGFLIGPALKRRATTLTCDFYFGRWRSAPIVVGDAASVTTELAKGLFTATVPATYLRHGTGNAHSYRIKKLFQHIKFPLFSIGFNVFTKRFYTKYESKY
ncbi:MAG: hypothetical protein VW103_08710 [Halieaceae bacterium]